MATVADVFLERAVECLRGEYLPRLGEAVDALPEKDLWWRPHAETNSVGNLLLHLEGNVRQWVLARFGGKEDHRDRASEFAAREGGTKAELYGALRETVLEACTIMETLTEEQLLTPYRIQGFDVNGLIAMFHMVEHFGWHVGQIVWIAKLRAGPRHGIAFYDDEAVNAARND